MGEIEKGIVIGITSGVISGLILAFILWRIDCWREKLQRKDQINYISSMIVKFRENIYHPDRNFSDLPPRARASIISAKPIRQWHKDMYESFCKQLESTLAGRADRLTFSEIQVLRQIFLVKSYWRDFDNNPSQEWYNYIFEWAESLEWLKIPPMTKTMADIRNHDCLYASCCTRMTARPAVDFVTYLAG